MAVTSGTIKAPAGKLNGKHIQTKNSVGDLI